MKASLQGMLELAKEYGLTAGMHNHVNYVGQAVWETQSMIAEMDPKWLGYYFDFHHAVALGGASNLGRSTCGSLPRGCTWSRRRISTGRK